MPLYEFQCPNCGAMREVTLPVDERDSAVPCIECWHFMTRLLSNPPAHFKGGGFYSTGG